MNAILLKQFIVHCDTLHEELNPFDTEVLGHLRVNGLEGLGVASAIIRGYADAQQYDGCARSLRPSDNGAEVFLDPGGRKASQTIITAELEDDQIRLERAQ